MRVNGKYNVYWQHTVNHVPYKTRKGNHRTKTLAYSQCFIMNTNTLTMVTTASYAHEINRYNRRTGMKESFDLAVKNCPYAEIRRDMWAAFLNLRKATIIVSTDTAELLSCVAYFTNELKRKIIEEDLSKCNEDWQAKARPDIMQYITGRLASYRQGSNVNSLLAIAKWAMIGLVNYENAKRTISIPKKE